MQRLQSALAPAQAAVTGEALRLFVAIAPPPGALAELDALAAPLRSARDDLRWTSIGAWHVTLAFLGQVPETALTGLLPRLERAAHRHPRIRLSFAGAGAFPEADRANVLWSGLSGDEEVLASLADAVAAEATAAGVIRPGKSRHFKPHLTLARCRLPADVSGLVAALAGYQGQDWTVDRIHLVRGQLNPGQPNGSQLAPSQTGQPLAGQAQTGQLQTGQPLPGQAQPAKPRYSSLARWPLCGAEPPANSVRTTG